MEVEHFHDKKQEYSLLIASMLPVKQEQNLLTSGKEMRGFRDF